MSRKAGPIRILITTGSRRWDTTELIKDLIQSFEPDLVITGDADGSDWATYRYCLEKKIFCIALHAWWKFLGTNAGPQRNADMVDLGVFIETYVSCAEIQVHGYPDKDSVGTFDCLSFARAAGLKAYTHPHENMTAGA